MPTEPINRNDPKSVREVVESLLPDKDVRRPILQLLASLVQSASATPDKWSVTLHADEFSLNIGGGYRVFRVAGQWLNLYWISTEGEDEPPGTTNGFKRLPESRLSHNSFQEILPWLEFLKPKVVHLIEQANLRSRAAQTPSSQRAHSPGVLRYLEEELDITVPNPQYPVPSILRTRYWVGGHQFGNTPMKDQFINAKAWWHGFNSPNDSPEAKNTIDLFEDISEGDLFAIKGYGGTNSLKIHFVGRVIEKDQDTQRLHLEPLPLPSPPSIHPTKGTGSWFGTLREVTDPAIIAWMFQQQNYVPTTQEANIMLPNYPLNTILYGPPGTGKTYETARRAVEIIDGTAPDDRSVLMARYKELQRGGQIGFVTFHQSYSYEDFIEGIRPVMDEEDGDGSPRYRIVDGVLKELAIKALGASLVAPEPPADGTPTFDLLWGALVEKIENDPLWTLPGRSNSTYQLTVTTQGNLQGVNIKGSAQRPYSATRKKIEQAWTLLPEDVEPTHKALMEVLKVGTHTNLIGAVIDELRSIAKKPLKNSVLPEKTPQEKADAFLQPELNNEYTLLKNPPRYVLIVDEINRGNISKILGELITLLEDDKRIGEENELTVTLPYSRESFALPPNLYLIGTMNTADKSLALLDVALRRRFTFKELTPNFNVCGLSPQMQKVLEELNRRITLRKDRDHRIGHAFFMKVGSDTGAFDAAFRGKVLPLLQEYFFNDWDGVRYVLGERDNAPGFVVPLDGGQEKGVRNRWQWYTDAGKELSPLVQLEKNYGPNTTA